jgi:signal transduction histidine kinase
VNQLQLAYRRTVDAEEEERHHLAVELHDDILSRLTTMALSLRNSQCCLATDPTRVHYWLEMLREETNYLNSRLREITQGLHPTILIDLGLIPALQAYLDSLAKHPKPDPDLCTVTLTTQGFNITRLIEQKLERDLYYITRQALDNALMHAQAEQIFVHLRWREDAISLTIQDTGCGMKNAPETLMGQNGHLGLISMKERALSWGGCLTFDTHPEQGTTVHAQVPTDQPSDSPTLLHTYTQHLARQVS